MFVTGDAARYVLVLYGDPDGARASQALSRVAEDLPELVGQGGVGEASTGVTGEPPSLPN
jgi:hypothetical protein